MSNINVNNLTPLLGSGSSVSVSGSLVVKNDVTIGGHLYIGDANTDSVTFSAEVSSSVVPDANITYDLGSSAKKWKELYLNSLVVKHITASGNISASGTGVNGTGSFHHVAVNGNVTSSGTGSYEGGIIANNATGSFGYVSASGDISTSGDIYGVTGSFEGGINCIGDGKNATGSFGYISSSGDISTSADMYAVSGTFEGGVSMSNATASVGYVDSSGDISSSASGSFLDLFVDDMVEIQGDINLHGNISSSHTSTGSFGYISASGDVSSAGTGSFFGGVDAAGATGSFGYISASGDISTSTAVHSVQYYTDSLLALTGNQTINTVKLGGATSVTQLHGLSIDITGSVSMSHILSSSADIITNTNVSASGTGSFEHLVVSGQINSDVSSSGTGSFEGGVDAGQGGTGSFAYISASGDISTSTAVRAVQYYTDSLIFATGDQSANVVKLGGAASVTQMHGLSIDVTGSISMSGALSMSGANAEIITEGGIYALGNISSSGILNANTAQFANNGINTLNINNSGAISASSTISGLNLVLKNSGVHKTSIDANGNIAAEGAISSSGVITGGSFNILNDGDNVFSVDINGAVSGASTLAGTALTLTTAGVHKASISAAGTVAAEGGISSSATLSGTSLNIKTAGVTKTRIDSSGNIAAEGIISSSGQLSGTRLNLTTNGVSKASIDALGTGSFLGGIDAGAGNATGSFGYVSASGDISTSANIHGVQYRTDNLIALTGDKSLNTVKLGGASSVTQLHGLSIDISGSVSMSGDLGVVNGTVYAPFYSNHHAVGDAQTLTPTSSGVPIVVTGTSTVTLPAVAVGHSYWIFNGNVDGTAITVSPDANDKFLINAAGAAGTDDKDLILTAGTAETGDYVKVAYGSGDGWIINERAGTWADQS